MIGSSTLTKTWDLLSQIAKMADRSFNDRVVLPVTALISRNGQGKPGVHWSFEMGNRGRK